MVRFRISQKAKLDIENIWLYTYYRWSKEQADRYHKLIFDEILYLANNFDSGQKMDEIKAEFRFSRVKSHFIFCRKTDKKVIEIVRILHQRMNIPRQLLE